MFQIVVLQTSYHAYMACIEELEALGLVRYKDFLMIEDAPEDSLFKANARQLFVTGTFSGSPQGVGEMVQKARGLNPSLVTVAYAIDVIDGPFERQVVKDGGARARFRQMIQDFLGGALNRTQIKWEPQPAPNRLVYRNCL